MKKLKHVVRSFGRKVHKQQTKSALEKTTEELFYDFNRSRLQVYKINFVRGIFFGLGSVLGGTVVLALLLAILGWLTDIPGGIGGLVSEVIQEVEQGK